MKMPSKPSAASRIAGSVVEAPGAGTAGAAEAAGAALAGDRDDHRRRPFAMPIISSLALTTLLEASNARWVTMREIISVPTFTFDASRKPWEIRPRPFAPGVPMSAAPELALATNRLSPAACSPEGLANDGDADGAELS